MKGYLLLIRRPCEWNISHSTRIDEFKNITHYEDFECGTILLVREENVNYDHIKVKYEIDDINSFKKFVVKNCFKDRIFAESSRVGSTVKAGMQLYYRNTTIGICMHIGCISAVKNKSIEIEGGVRVSENEHNEPSVDNPSEYLVDFNRLEYNPNYVSHGKAPFNLTKLDKVVLKNVLDDLNIVNNIDRIWSHEHPYLAREWFVKDIVRKYYNKYPDDDVIVLKMKEYRKKYPILYEGTERDIRVKLFEYAIDNSIDMPENCRDIEYIIKHLKYLDGVRLIDADDDYESELE